MKVRVLIAAGYYARDSRFCLRSDGGAKTKNLTPNPFLRGKGEPKNSSSYNTSPPGRGRRALRAPGEGASIQLDPCALTRRSRTLVDLSPAEVALDVRRRKSENIPCGRSS